MNSGEDVVVLVNSITKQPTCFEPHPETPRIFDGPYQNVAHVTREWQAEARRRVDTYDARYQMEEMYLERRRDSTILLPAVINLFRELQGQIKGKSA